MNFELTIAGLCVLVDDPKQDCVHVIVPATGHGGHGHDDRGRHEQHTARFVHPAASGAGSDLADGYRFDCTTLAAPGSPTIGIPGDVLNIARVCASAKHIVDAIITSPDRRKSAHVVLRGGTIARAKDLVCCTIKGDLAYVAGQLTWTISMHDANRKLIGDRLFDEGEALSITPRQSDGVLRMGLVSATARDMPTTLEDLQEIRNHRFEHFSAFYPLFETECVETPGECGSIRRYPSQCMSAQTSRA